MNFIKSTISELKHEPGIYQITFPNEMIYIGSSQDIKDGVLSVIINCLSLFPNSKWYRHAGYVMQKYQLEKQISGIEAFNQYCIIEVYYTSEKEIPRECAKQCLAEVYNCTNMDNYYNTIFYKYENGKYTGKTIKKDF